MILLGQNNNMSEKVIQILILWTFKGFLNLFFTVIFFDFSTITILKPVV